MPSKLYGIAEIAEALGLTRQAVTVWRKRGSWGLPEPDAELSSGPVWQGETIEPWLKLQRARLSEHSERAPIGPDDIKRAGRRLLRLLLLLLEDSPRANLLQQALSELGDYGRHVHDFADDANRAQLLDLLEPVITVISVAPEVAASTEAQTLLARRLVEALPRLGDMLLKVDLLPPVANGQR
jgi:hypothetical protein